MSKRLRNARRQRGYSRAQLARRIGISLSHMAELENGDVLPSISTLRTLCLILDVSADYLLFGYRTVPLKSRK
ncbi:MAG: helix-turn-helix transcriptional regulator [Oscillibacter sp.]|nr:helix-turn-helix transcriptional regulator [Oscillibacter sp.]